MNREGIGAWPSRRARMTPDRAALVHGDQVLTYADLAARVNLVAHALRERGVGAGTRVAYLGPNHPAFLETMFASTALGGVFVPLNTRLAAAEISYMLADCGATVLVWDSSCVDTVHGLVDVPVQHYLRVANRTRPGADTENTRRAQDYEEAVAATEPRDSADRPVSLDDVAMIMYTSGTTERPKGAMLTHGNLTWNCYNLLVDLDITSEEVALVNAPMFHTAALNHTVLPVFLKGGTSVLAARFDPNAALADVQRHRVTLMFGVPAMYQQMAASEGWATADLSSVRILHCGGAPVPLPLITTYQERGLPFVQGYGLTEASPGTMVLRPEDAERKLGSAGKAHFFTEVRVIRPDGTPAATGETGEVVVCGPNVMQGYWHRPEESTATLRDGWLHTGDAALVDDDGYVYIVDRIKDIFISGGENVAPAEVESALLEHPDIAECVVFGVADERWGEVGRAVVVLRDGALANPDDLLKSLDGRLARYKIPRSLILADTLPRNATGKIRKPDVRQLFGSP
jgi:fatty-acyl-CoA synthase